MTVESTEMHTRQIQQFVVIITFSNAVINFAVFAFGVYALYSKMLTNLQVFQILLIIAILIDVLLTYLTIVNMLLLIIKCLLMFVTRHLVSSLLTLLILPLSSIQ